MVRRADASEAGQCRVLETPGMLVPVNAKLTTLGFSPNLSCDERHSAGLHFGGVNPGDSIKHAKAASAAHTGTYQPQIHIEFYRPLLL